MSRSGRPRHLDVLTPRQREVLELLRLGLTNEQIADRLGITLDGAKYHVAEILGRLGVSSREEAAAWRPEERKPWWAAVPLPAWPLWLKAAGGVVVVAAAAGIAVLVWGVIVTKEGEDGPAGVLARLTVEEAYARIAEATRRPGFVLHSTAEVVGPTEDGETAPFYTLQFWIDVQGQALREEFRLDPSRDSYDIATESTTIVIDGYIYVPDDPGEAFRYEIEELCPGATDTLVSRLLECGGGFFSFDFAQAPPRLDVDAEYEGRAAVAIVIETGGQPPSDENPATVRIYLDREAFLPLARVVEFRRETEPDAVLVSEYRHEFVPADSLATDFLDPRSIGYGAENEDALLDEIAREVPVYWLGTEIELPADLCPPFSEDCSLVLTRVDPRGESGAQGELWYETPQGVTGILILLWRAEDWEGFMASTSGELLTNPRCAARTETALDDRRATVFVLPELPVPYTPPEPVPYTPSTTPEPYATPTPDPDDPCAHRVLGADPFLTLSKIIAVIDYGDVVVDVRADITGYHRSLDAVEAVLGGLRRR